MKLSTGLDPILGYSVVASTVFKLLLVPGYRSTDFEVHRNWLALTHSLPVSQWYYEARSQWTLDYPPFFAYFEWALGKAGAALARVGLADARMLEVGNLEYASAGTVLFQRVSVLVSELVLVYALQRFVDGHGAGDKRRAYAVALCVYFSPGFVLVDSIHFQYNMMLFGLLVWSFVLLREGRLVAGGGAFAVLLCFKHIFLYLAPAYFAYLLRTVVVRSVVPPEVDWRRTAALGAVVVGVFAAAFAPFAYWGQMPQLLARLFPFSRGLCHAYWAPNVWALYSAADRVLLAVGERAPWAVRAVKGVSPTAGLVGEATFSVLPAVPPRLTFVLTLFYQLQALGMVLWKPSYERFLGAVTLCAYASFLFGWHVHEKAIMLVLVPFTFLATKDRRFLVPFWALAAAGCVSLFPLLIAPAEAPIKYVYTVTWAIAFYVVFGEVAPVGPTRRVFLFDRLSTAYVLGFVPLCAATAVAGAMRGRGGWLDKYEFVELMATSIYCSLGVIGSWFGVSWLYFFGEW
ncbi:glycosyl transferase [Dipodascopsis tothii]|uniref:glycosyl transferase n=1 Tax=Dipodascopsis tothii TaxID=44089 RepID=UPI0034CFA40C